MYLIVIYNLRKSQVILFNFAYVVVLSSFPKWVGNLTLCDIPRFQFPLKIESQAILRQKLTSGF